MSFTNTTTARRIKWRKILLKTLFSQYARDGLGSIAYKKPIAPGHDEVLKNPRARSAKLRVFEKA